MSTNDQKNQFIELWLLPFCIGSFIAIGYWVSNKSIHSKPSDMALQRKHQFSNKKLLIQADNNESLNKRFAITNLEKTKSRHSVLQKKYPSKIDTNDIPMQPEKQTSKIRRFPDQKDAHLNPSLFFKKYSLDRIIQSLPNP